MYRIFFFSDFLKIARKGIFHHQNESFVDVDENMLVPFRWLVPVSESKGGILGLDRGMHCTSGQNFAAVVIKNKQTNFYLYTVFE